MNLKLILIIASLVVTIPVYALDCRKKPCHSKCISNQSETIKIQCMCKKRKNVYYKLALNFGTGVPEYNEACDGSFEQYAIKYCEAKRHYDNAYLSNPYYTYTYTPKYDQICDGSYEEYSRKVQLLKQNQAINNMADALRKPVEINVNHKGTIKQDIQLNGTIRTDNYNYWF